MRVYLGFVLFCCALGYAQTELCGPLSMPTTLTKARSPYLVTGDLYVPPASRLTIEEGVVLLISTVDSCRRMNQLDWSDSQFVSIKVDGALYIHGTLFNPVVIQSADSTHQSIRWDGIRIWNQTPQTADIQFLKISEANKALWTYKTTMNIHHTLFQNNNTGIWSDYKSTLTIENNLFHDNRSAGVYIKLSTPVLTANLFVQNPTYGIWADSRQGVVISHNLFWNNGEANCFHCPAQILQMTETNHRGDSTDAFMNLAADPVFIDSPQELKLRRRDPNTQTPADSVQDTRLYQIHAKADSLGKAGLKPRAQFVPQGYGPFRLSQYSPALDAAPEDERFQDANQTRGDLGIFGATLKYQK